MKVGFRADASMTLGSGHVMRCLCLANELRNRGIDTVFTSASMPAHLRCQVEQAGHRVAMLSPEALGDEIRDAEETLSLVGDVNRMVLDHYGLGGAWEHKLQTQASVLAIDDLARPHEATWVLDQNFHSDAQARYSGRLSPATHGFFGPHYALLRPEFAAARAMARVRAHGLKRVLVFLGGMDAANMTSIVLEALDLAQLPDLQVDVVAGALHPALDHLRRWCDARARTALHVQVSDMAKLMLSADLAIGAGGQSTWERCALGLPAITICLAENQREVIVEGARAGFLLGIEDVPRAGELADMLKVLSRQPRLVEALSARALQVTDARGTARVASLLCPPEVSVRLATMDDAADIYAWRTDEKVRGVSRSTGHFSFEAHCEWMQGVLSNPSRLLLIGQRQGTGIGVARFDIEQSRAEVSIFLSSSQWGVGMGSALLGAAEQHLKQYKPEIACIDAWVTEGNDASVRMFGRAGYEPRIHRFDKEI